MLLQLLARSTALLSVAATTASLASQVPGYRFEGTLAEAQLGYATAGAGDVNADGYDDLVVGMPGARNAHGDDAAGRVCVYSGADQSLLYEFEGDTTGERLGYSVRAAGDVNGDGCWDIIVGAPGSPLSPALGGSETGSVRVISGMDGTDLFTFLGGDTDDSFGYSVAGVGDVNADGFRDVIVGACEDDSVHGVDSGTATVFSGSDGSVLHTVHGDAAGWLFGWSVCGVGDVDGDGREDFAVGSPFALGESGGLPVGRVRVFSGLDASVLRDFEGTAALDQFGMTVCNAGDLDGDGFYELIVGAPGDDTVAANAGAAYVYAGVDGSERLVLHGRTEGDFAGFSVDGAGDVDGDGIYDVVIGEPGYDANGAAETGALRVFRGTDGSLLRAFDGPVSGDNFGWSVSGAGDVDANGIDDLVVGAPSADVIDTNAGQAYLLRDVTRVPTIERIFGAPCVGGEDRVPRIGYHGQASIETTIRITLRGAAPLASTCTLAVGHATELPLDIIGATGCTLYSDPFVLVSVMANAAGQAEIPVFINGDAGLFGIAIDFQWVLIDTLAPRALPISMSDALRLIYGS